MKKKLLAYVLVLIMLIGVLSEYSWFDVNAYEEKCVTVDVEVDVIGYKDDMTDLFEFELYSSDNSKTVAKAKTDKNGELVFNNLKFYSPGIYEYYVVPVLPEPLKDNYFHNYKGINYLEKYPKKIHIEVFSSNGVLLIQNNGSNYDRYKVTFQYEKTNPLKVPVNLNVYFFGNTLDDYHGLKYSLNCSSQYGTAAKGMDNKYNGYTDIQGISNPATSLEYGEVLFEELIFNEEGSYKFDINSILPEDYTLDSDYKGIRGMWDYNDTLEFKVEENRSTGALFIKNQPNTCPLGYLNYKYSSSYTIPAGTKIAHVDIVGAPMEAEIFTYELKDLKSNNDVSISNDGEGNVYLIDDLCLTIPQGATGYEYEFLLTQLADDHYMVGGIGMEYDKNSTREIYVDLSDNNDGTAQIQFYSELGTTDTWPVLSFKNKYLPKIQMGGYVGTAGAFGIYGSLALLDSNKNVIDTAESSQLQWGNLFFKEIEITEDMIGKSYTYYIRQNLRFGTEGTEDYFEYTGPWDGSYFYYTAFSYDTSLYKYVVSINKDSSGYVYVKYNGNYIFQTPRFINISGKYEKDFNAELNLKVELENKKLEEGYFTFDLCDEKGEVLQTAKNDKDGNVTFNINESEIVLDGSSEKDFKYTVKQRHDRDYIEYAEDYEVWAQYYHGKSYISGDYTFKNVYTASGKCEVKVNILDALNDVTEEGDLREDYKLNDTIYVGLKEKDDDSEYPGTLFLSEKKVIEGTRDYDLSSKFDLSNDGKKYTAYVVRANEDGPYPIDFEEMINSDESYKIYNGMKYDFMVHKLEITVEDDGEGHIICKYNGSTKVPEFTYQDSFDKNYNDQIKLDFNNGFSYPYYIGQTVNLKQDGKETYRDVLDYCNLGYSFRFISEKGVFSGFYTDKECTKQLDLDDIIDGNKTIYSGYTTEDASKITYIANMSLFRNIYSRNYEDYTDKLVVWRTNKPYNFYTYSREESYENYIQYIAELIQAGYRNVEYDDKYDGIGTEYMYELYYDKDYKQPIDDDAKMPSELTLYCDFEKAYKVDYDFVNPSIAGTGQFDYENSSEFDKNYNNNFFFKHDTAFADIIKYTPKVNKKAAAVFSYYSYDEEGNMPVKGSDILTKPVTIYAQYEKDISSLGVLNIHANKELIINDAYSCVSEMTIYYLKGTEPILPQMRYDYEDDIWKWFSDKEYTKEINDIYDVDLTKYTDIYFYSGKSNDNPNPTPTPSLQPSEQPTSQPSNQPTSQPGGQPTSQPNGQPTVQPNEQPTSQPDTQPTQQPGVDPKAKVVDGVGTISADGTTITDSDGTKYLVSEKVTKDKLAKGTNIADKKSAGKYKITKLTKKKGKVTGGEISYLKPYNKNSSTVVVKDTVNIGGVKFVVTAVNANAYKECDKLTKVTIGKNVTKINKNAFKDCGSLKTIIIKTKKLKKVGKDAFSGINKKAKFTVPKKKYSKYKKMIKKSGAPKNVKYVKK